MRRICLMIVTFLGIVAIAEAHTSIQPIVDGVSVNDMKMQRNGDYMVVDMTLDIKKLDVSGNRAVLITPRLVNSSDSTDFQSVGIYGRSRYYFYVRKGISMLTGKDELSFRASEKPDEILYHNIIPYADWMDGAKLLLYRRDWGCCNKMLAQQYGELDNYSEERAFFPKLVYLRPQPESVKSRSLQGSAFVDFPVDQIIIYPSYRYNIRELGKIQATIDSVRNDRDIQITSVWLKGHASPESPYIHNRDLAIGRTEALRIYIRRLYSFKDGIISTDYEPENWDGLRRYVEQSNLDHRAEILAMIDSDEDPDVKEWKIKSRYPDEYRFLLDNCYPALRNTDYRIEYVVRGYSDIVEIKNLIKTQPQKLSLNEFYIAAQEYEPGTEEFTEVFETAVRLFPNDPVANLNAANAAIRRNDNARAARYLERAGHSAEALYARGALAIRMKDYETAQKYLAQAKELGLTQAASTIDELSNKRH